jgi:glycine cleavage system H protein
MIFVAGFEFPAGLHYQAEDQTWARLEGDGTATVGITALGIHQAGGEIYMCRPRSVGQAVEQRRSIAVVEVAKAVLSVKSPVRGEVVAVNDALASRPELVHLRPYGEGWLVRVRLADFDADAAQLVTGETVAAAMQRAAWLDGLAEAPDGAS